jgi:hypothetical protein
MKRLLSLITILMVLSVAAFAANNAILNLSGTIPGVLNIDCVAEAAATTLDLSTDQTDLLIGTVTEKCNRKAGYTVTLTTTNGAKFKSADVANTATLSYTLKYGGVGVVFVAGSATVTDAGAKTPQAGTPKTVSITYSGSTWDAGEDTYTDSLTFVITAK